MRDELGERRLPVRARPLVGRDDKRAGAVVDARRVAGGVRALLPDQAGELRQRLERGPTARALVDLDLGVALLRGDRHGHDLVGHPALVDRGQRALMRAQRPAVKVRPRQLELVADLGRLIEHLPAAERVRQPVVDHRVERLRVAHAIAEARLRQRLHATADTDLDVARADGLVEDHGRAQPRGADLVDRLGADVLRNAGADLRLPRRDLALPGLEHLPHDDVVDLRWIDVRSLQRGGDGDATDLGGLESRKAATQLADRRAGGAKDHCLGHRSILLT